jgi:uncharacterized protein YecT (DUF1311 family)
MIARAAALAVVFLACSPAPGVGDPDDADIAEYQQQFQQADQDLNQSYHTVMGTLDPATQASLKSAQRAWIVFKEADFANYRRLLRAAGKDYAIYGYETNEEKAQAISLKSIGKEGQSDSQDDDPAHTNVKTPLEADQKLNTVYRQLMDVLASDTAMVLAEKSAEASWIQFRDRFCQVDASMKGGQPDDAVLRDLTLRRTSQLARSVRTIVESHLAVPEGSNDAGDDQDEKPTDLPVADPFRFAK